MDVDNVPNKQNMQNNMQNQVIFSSVIKTWRDVFAEELGETPRLCKNRCINCLPEQLPKGCVASLYHKNDDFRHGALYGNYITFANVTHDDIEHIRELGVPHYNIAVHSTETVVRRRILGNPNARDVMNVIKRLTDSDITINAAIDLCRGVNDRAGLEKTILDLKEYFPNVQGVIVRPVAITKHRKGLHCLQRYDVASAKAVLAQVIKLQRRFLEEIGTRFVFVTDELYYMAQMPFPRAAHYEKFPYIIEHVGVAAKVIKEFEAALKEISLPQEAVRKTIISGAVHGRMMEQLIEKLPYDTVDSWVIENKFLGSDASVAEVFAGQDVIDTLAGRDIGELLLVHRHNLFDGDMFVDGLTLEEVAKELGVQVKVFDGGSELLERMLW